MNFDPIGEPESFYSLLVAGERAPGITEVDGNEGSPRKFDEQTGYALSFATLKFIGRGAPKFDSVTYLYTREEHLAWEAFFKRRILPPPKIVNGVAQALDVLHPKLVLHQIKAAVVLNVALPKITEEGVTQILINWQAWYPRPRMQLAKVEVSQAAPVDFAEQEIERKVNILKRVDELGRG